MTRAVDDVFMGLWEQLTSLTERVRNLESQENPNGFGPALMWAGLVTTTNVPAITIVELYNGFNGVTFAGSNVGAGLWNITASSAVLTAGLTMVTGGRAQTPTGQMADVSVLSTTQVRLTTYSAAATPADINLASTPVIIMAWPS